MNWDTVQKEKRLLSIKLDGEISVLETRKLVLISEFETQATQLDIIKKDLISKKHISEDLTKKVNTDKVIIESNLDKRRALLVERRELIKANDDLREEIQSLKAEKYVYEQFVEEKKKLKVEIDKLEVQKNNMLEIIEVLKSEIEGLQTQKTTAGENLDKVCKLLESTKTELEVKKIELDEREKVVSRNELTLKEREIDIALKEGVINKEWERMQLRLKAQENV